MKWMEAARQGIWNMIRPAEASARIGFRKLAIQKDRALDLRKSADARTRRRIDDLLRHIDRMRRSGKRAEGDLVKQKKWADRQLDQLLELENRKDEETDARRKKALDAELKRRFRAFSNQSEPMMRGLEIMNGLNPGARDVEKALDGIERRQEAL